MNQKFIYLIRKVNLINFVKIFLLSLLVAILSLAPIKLIEYMIDTINHDLSKVLYSGAILLVVYFITAGIKAYKNIYVESLGLEFSNQLRKDVFKRVLNLSYKQHKSYRTDKQSASILEDVKIVSDSSIKPLSKLIESVSSFLIGVILVFSISPYITIVLLVVGLISTYANKRFIKKYENLIDDSRTSSDKIWKLFDDINTYFEEILTNNRVKRFEKLTEKESDLFKNHHLKESRFTQKIYAIDTIIFMGTIGILYIITSILVYYKQMTVGGMMAIMMYNSILIDPLIDITKAIKEWRRVVVSLNRLEKIPKSERLNDKKPLKFIDKIELKDVSFVDDNKAILKDINFDINKGDKLAIVGKSGSGKSTILRIIQGLISPTSGEVTFDGTSISNEMDISSNFSVLNQECIIIPDSLKANLDLYIDQIKASDIEMLIKQLDLTNILEPNDLDSPLTFSSGGENKRIGLLRTFLREAPIYIFDELSNSLDDVNLERVMNYIKRELSDKTIIMVDHRIKDATFFNKVIYLEEGKVVKINYQDSGKMLLNQKGN